MKTIVAGKNEAGQRLDKLLSKILNKAPKSFIYKMLRKKNITLNDKKAEGSEIVQPGDRVNLYLADETVDKFSEGYVSPTPVNKEEFQKKSDISLKSGIQENGKDKRREAFQVVYEDSEILLINKPAGMLSQKAKNTDISLVEYLMEYLLGMGSITTEELATFKPGICNRLDRNTSGLVAAGKTLIGLQTLSMLLRERTLDKYYLCLVKGEVKETKKITGYLKKNEKTNQVSISLSKQEGADPIETEYMPIKQSPDYTLLRVKLITGKTHQIRAHLSSIGHPIVGDSKYGSKQINDSFKRRYRLDHQLLHSYQMLFPDNLTGELAYLSGRMFQAEPPKEFETILKDCFGSKGRN